MAIWATGERITAARLNDQEVTTITVTGVITASASKGHRLGMAGGSGYSSALAQADANILLYALTSTNWAGIGSDGSGNVYFRTGLSGTPAAALAILNDGQVAIRDSAWNGGHIALGAYHLWVDGSGRLRIKNGAPASDTDGTIIGTQS